MEPYKFSYGHTEIHIHGGLNSIGGNCIVIRSPEKAIMLDQGMNFRILSSLYGGAIQPANVEELRTVRVLPPRDAYDGVDEIYISHLHLDHLGSLNIPRFRSIRIYLPSVAITEVLSHTWWFGWKQYLMPPDLSFKHFMDVKESNSIRYELVSHSAYPAYAFRIDTDDVSILYTGDFRTFGPLNNSFSKLRELAEDGVDIAIIEGTNFSRRMSYLTPTQFKSLFGELLEKYKQNVLFLTASPLDFEATICLIERLWEYGYLPAFENPYYAQLMDTVLDFSGYELEQELAYIPMRTTGTNSYEHLEVWYLSELRDRKLAILVPATAVKDIATILKLLDITGESVIHVTIFGEPLEEEWLIEEERIGNWLSMLGVTSYRIHLSGHYHPYEFGEILNVLKPKNIVPIHTLSPRLMLSTFEKYYRRYL